MSNPAVIILDNADFINGKFKRFQLEDNIGESIHLHIDNIRVDFTVTEFLEFASLIENSLEELDFLCGYKLSDFDIHFLKKCADYLTDLKEITIEKIKLSELKCIVYSDHKKNKIPYSICSIEETPVYKYLQGDRSIFKSYNQFNYFGVDNEKRLNEIIDSIRINKYPFNDQYIILFDNQNYIRDGQHRAAALAYLFGADTEIEVMRFKFNGTKHLIQTQPKSVKRKIKTFTGNALKKIKRFIIK